MSSHDLEYLFPMSQGHRDEQNFVNQQRTESSKNSIFFANSNTQVLIPKDVKEEIIEDLANDFLDTPRSVHKIDQENIDPVAPEAPNDFCGVLAVTQDDNDTIHIEYLTAEPNGGLNVREDVASEIDIKEEWNDLEIAQEINLQDFESTFGETVQDKQQEEEEPCDNDENSQPEISKKKTRKVARHILKDFSTVEKIQTRRMTRDNISLQIESIDDNLTICPFKGCKKQLTANYINQHIKVVHNKMRKKCLKCGNEIVPSHVSRHRERCGKELKKEVKCKHKNCNAVFRTTKEIYQHEWNVHRDRIPCLIQDCGQMVKPAGLKKHIRSVHEAITERCKHCGSTFKKKYIKQHLKICTMGKDMERNFKCTEENCEATFRLQSDVKSHVWRVHREPINCPFDGCDVLVNPIRLEQHIKYVHDKRKVKCQKCDKVIMESSYACHLKSCTGEVKYNCPVKGCKKKFKCSSERNKHVSQIHKSGYPCTFGNCERIFIRMSVLRRHIRMIHTDPTQICLKCNKEIRSSYMYKHLKICNENVKVE